jgi:hypothetical protein
VGGYDPATGTPVPYVDVYDPIAHAWTQNLAPMPTPLFGHGTAVVDGKILAIGGWNGGGTQALVEVLDPATLGWTFTTSLLGARDTPAAAVAGGVAYVAGGHLDPTIALSTVEAFVPDTACVVASEDFSIDASATPDRLWPPNHRMVPVALSVTASDACGPATCRIVAVASNESTNGAGDGNAAPDWQVTGDLTLELRAERSGTGSGRTYGITLECADPAGNLATRILEVVVPLSQGGA